MAVSWIKSWLVSWIIFAWFLELNLGWYLEINLSWYLAIYLELNIGWFLELNVDWFLELNPVLCIFVTTRLKYFSTINFLPLDSIYWWINPDLSDPHLVSSYSTSLRNNSCPIFEQLTINLNPLICSIFLWHPSTLSESSFAIQLMIFVAHADRGIGDIASLHNWICLMIFFSLQIYLRVF